MRKAAEIKLELDKPLEIEIEINEPIELKTPKYIQHDIRTLLTILRAIEDKLRKIDIKKEGEAYLTSALVISRLSICLSEAGMLFKQIRISQFDFRKMVKEFLRELEEKPSSEVERYEEADKEA